MSLMQEKNKNIITRRKFLKVFGGGTTVAATALYGCSSKETEAYKNVPTDKMTYRINPSTGDKVSILGYGCMRLPTVQGKDNEIDQNTVNKLTDYAIAHGVNYFDTSPAYCQGHSEEAMGNALSRHPRNKYFVATKLSNFDPASWSREASMEMYHNSFKKLKVEYIDYMLLHGIGMGGRGSTDMSGMDAFKGRYIDNGMLNFLLEERKAKRIRNLGFSYHGDVKVFDYLLSTNIKWDFVQIEMNYVDWKHAKESSPFNTNAEYLYGELKKRHIPAVIMEPLLGGRLANLNHSAMELLKQMNPDATIASWAFRFAGSSPGVLTVLSGMTYMENLQDNICTYSPLKTLSSKEQNTLEKVARLMLDLPLIPCNACQYCMPCPYGLDIPDIFVHYNKCLNEGNYSKNAVDKNYSEARRAFLIGYDRSVPKLRQADHCTGCGKCMPHCPQSIDIPKTMQSIDHYVNELKLNV